MPGVENSFWQSVIAASIQMPQEMVAATSWGALLDGRCSKYAFALPGSVTLAVQTWIKGLKSYVMGGREQRR